MSCLLASAWVAACSVVNNPDDPIAAEDDGSGGGGNGGMGAAGSGGEGGSSSCGDGEVQDGEDCDEGGVESATCDTDCTVAECGDGTVNQSAGEDCDGSGASENCNEDCTISFCGDGKINTAANEECDDSNATSGDGCSSSCLIEGSCGSPMPLDLMNGTAQIMTSSGGLNQVPAANCDGTMQGSGSERVYELTITEVSSITADVIGMGWDVILRMLTDACDPSSEVPADNEPDGCSNVGAGGAGESLVFSNVPPGTYYIVVDGAGDMDEGPFTLNVSASSTVTDCNDAKMKFPTAPSGIFALDPDGAGGAMPFDNYCDMTQDGGGWTLIARFSNADLANWMLDTGEWWYTTNTAQGDPTSAVINLDMLSPAFWTVPAMEMKITRTDSGDGHLLMTNVNCLGGQDFRSFITGFGNFQNGVVWASAQVLGTCGATFGGNYLNTQGFGEVNCTGEIGAPQTISFWSDWSSGDGAVMMIGGGGSSCAGGPAFRADHGIGITEANAASFVDAGAGEDDFGDDPSVASDPGYALNLFVR